MNNEPLRERIVTYFIWGCGYIGFGVGVWHTVVHPMSLGATIMDIIGFGFAFAFCAMIMSTIAESLWSFVVWLVRCLRL